jgi:hypothetical protein
VVNEHRGEIIARYGDAGREFLRYVDIVQSAAAVYGVARLALGMAQLVNGFRTSYQNWRAAARQLDTELSDGERAVVQQVSQQADEVLQNVDDITAARTKPAAGAGGDPAGGGGGSAGGGPTGGGGGKAGGGAGGGGKGGGDGPEIIAPERQLPAPRPPSAKERLAQRRAAQEETARLDEIRQGMERVDRELAAGTHGRRFGREDLDWLDADPRHKALAYDPDIKTYRVAEARQALAAEEARVLPGPVVRSTKPGADIIDGAGVGWSIKGTGPGATVESTAALIAGEAAAGRPCLGDLRAMSLREQAGVRTLVLDQLGEGTHAEVRFVPAGVERIPPR